MSDDTVDESGRDVGSGREDPDAADGEREDPDAVDGEREDPDAVDGEREDPDAVDGERDEHGDGVRAVDDHTTDDPTGTEPGRDEPVTESLARNGNPSPPADSASDTDWRSLLSGADRIVAEAADAILAVHGDRGRRAIDAVGEGRVKQYRDFTVVVGRTDEYIVEEGACTCKDAEYNLDPADPDQLCWHALAVEIARRVDAVDHHDMWYSEVRDFV